MSNELTTASAAKELLAILRRINKEKPAEEELNLLRKILKRSPDMWRRAGDMARTTQQQILDNVQGPALIKESIARGLEVMREDLRFEEASALEKLLIEQIILSWLHFHTIQWGYETNSNQGTTLQNAAFLERRLNGAQRRYLRAIETLARIRKMGPAVQINIAKRQLNLSRPS